MFDRTFDGGTESAQEILESATDHIGMEEAGKIARQGQIESFQRSVHRLDDRKYRKDLFDEIDHGDSPEDIQAVVVGFQEHGGLKPLENLR